MVDDCCHDRIQNCGLSSSRIALHSFTIFSLVTHVVHPQQAREYTQRVMDERAAEKKREHEELARRIADEEVPFKSIITNHDLDDVLLSDMCPSVATQSRDA